MNNILITLAHVFALFLAFSFIVSLSGCEQQETQARGTNAKVVVAVFIAEGCYGCDQVKPVLASLIVRGVDVTVIDIYKRPDMASRYDVTQVPIFFVWVGNRSAVRTEDIGTVAAICNRAL
jgi:thiol-disulfide isomerase/thioredoxin